MNGAGLRTLQETVNSSMVWEFPLIAKTNADY